MSMPEERALGAAIIAVLIGIVGALVLIAGILGLIQVLLGYSWSAFDQNSFLALFTGSQTIAAAVAVVIGLILLGIATGLYRQHYWALIVMFIFGILYLIGETSGVVYNLYYANPTLPITNANVLGAFVGIVIVILVLIYLAAVRDDFI